MPREKIHPNIQDHGGLKWPALFTGTLIRRYKRFLADVQLSSGEIVTAHCSNSGAMATCCEPGRVVYLSFHDNPRRKLKYSWEMIEMPASLVGVNTLVPNRLAFCAIRDGVVTSLAGYDTITSEVKAGQNSRIDLLLTRENGDRCFIEIKNCTRVREKIASFPDAVTLRGRKHLIELRKLRAEGCRCVMFYVIQRMDADLFEPADDIDPEYGRELRRAVAAGVEIAAHDTILDLDKIVLNRSLPVRL